MASRKIFYGWWILILSFVLGIYGGGTIWYGFTAFFDPLIKEFAWSYTAISLAASLRGAEFGLIDAIIGFLADRFSIRRIILGSSILVGIGWFILSRVNSLGMFYISFFIICTAAGGIGSVVFLTLLARWFHKRIGLVIGLTTAGFGAGGLMVPGIVYLLDVVGFRTVFFTFGITALTLGGIAAYFLRDWPKDVGSSPDGISIDPSEDIPKQIKLAGSEDIAPDYTIRQVLSKPAFWVITFASIANSFSMTGVTTHIMPHLEHLGYARNAASPVAMALALLSIFGRLTTGWMLDKIAFRVVLIILLLGQLTGSILLIYSNLFFLLILFVISFGVTRGGIMTLRPVALRKCFGTGRIGSILGLCVGFSQVGSIASPIFAGWIFDTTGNFSLAWVVTSILLLVSIPLVATMKQAR